MSKRKEARQVAGLSQAKMAKLFEISIKKQDNKVFLSRQFIRYKLTIKVTSYIIKSLKKLCPFWQKKFILKESGAWGLPYAFFDFFESHIKQRKEKHL